MISKKEHKNEILDQIRRLIRISPLFLNTLHHFYTSRDTPLVVCSNRKSLIYRPSLSRIAHNFFFSCCLQQHNAVVGPNCKHLMPTSSFWLLPSTRSKPYEDNYNNDSYTFILLLFEVMLWITALLSVYIHFSILL